MGVGPVEFAESDPVEGHLRVVPGGLKFARRFGQCGAALCLQSVILALSGLRLVPLITLGTDPTR